MNRTQPALLLCLLFVACSEPAAPAPLEAKTVRSALDVPSDYRPTPYGWVHESCIHAHPNGQKVDLKRQAPCAYPRIVVDPRPPGSGGHYPTADSWQIDTESTVSTPAIHMTSIMQVPAAPSTPNHGALDYFFPGMSPTNADVILQPVLQFGVSPAGGGQKWGIASWSCDVVTGAGCNHSDLFDVATGDVILGTIDGTNCTSAGACDWAITTTDLTNGATTTLNTTGDIHTYLWLFTGVLEAYGVTTCTDYPANGTEAFSNVVFSDKNNQPINAVWKKSVWDPNNPANCPVMDATFTNTSALLQFTNKTPPTVQLTPGDGPVTSPMVSLTATATPGAGSTLASLAITRNGTQMVADSTGATSLGYTWNTSGLPNGAYTFAAVATDADGAGATAYSTLQVLNPPTVTITGGINGKVSGQAQIQAAASPPQGTTLSKLELRYGGNVVATGTNMASWMLDTTTLSNGTGSSVTATAIDADGSNASAMLNLTIANPPVVSLTAPAAGGGMVALSASATPAMGTQLATIEIQVDGNKVVGDAAATVSGSWDSTGTLNGSTHTVQAFATGSDGVQGQSMPVTLTVKNVPKVTISAQPTGEAGKPYVVAASAAAALGTTLTQLVLEIDGEQASTSATGQLSYSWKTDDKEIGTHQLTARATGSDGTLGVASMSFTITKAKGCGCDAGGALPVAALALLALLRRRR